MNTAEKLLEDMTNAAGTAYPGFFTHDVTATNIPIYPANFSINNIQIYPTNFYNTRRPARAASVRVFYDATTSREFTAGSGLSVFFHPSSGRSLTPIILAALKSSFISAATLKS